MKTPLNVSGTIILQRASTSNDPAPASNDIVSLASTSPQRRMRQPTGRDHQFNVRLRRETVDFIYSEANSRNVPIAQVIEEMVAAFMREQGRG